MKTLLILGIVYAISLTVVAIILLDHKRRTQTLPVENGWWYPLIALGAPFIVLVVPVVLIRVLMKRRNREEAQTRRKEKANQKFLKRAYARMAKMPCYELGAEHPLNCNVAQGLRQQVTNNDFEHFLECLNENNRQNPDVHLTVKTKLQVETNVGNSWMASSKLYIQNDDKVRDYQVFKYLEFARSFSGVWKAFLLLRLDTYLPKVWHGNYHLRKYFYTQEDMMQPLGYCGTENLAENGFDITPRVYTNGRRHYVQCCYWNNWKGLVRETMELQFDRYGRVKAGYVGEEILYKYKSPILI